MSHLLLNESLQGATTRSLQLEQDVFAPFFLHLTSLIIQARLPRVLQDAVAPPTPHSAPGGPSAWECRLTPRGQGEERPGRQT